MANANAAISAAARMPITSSEESLTPPWSGSASTRTWTRPPSKAGPWKPATRSSRPPSCTPPFSGRRFAPASGSVEATRSVPELTTTPVSVTRSTSSAYACAPIADSMSVPAVSPRALISRVRAGASASPPPVSNRPSPSSVIPPRATSCSRASASKRR